MNSDLSVATATLANAFDYVHGSCLDCQVIEDLDIVRTPITDTFQFRYLGKVYRATVTEETEGCLASMS